MIKKHIISPGDRFDKLTIIKELEPRLRSQHDRSSFYERYFECQCDCGKIITVRLYHLTSGHTKSCGCLKKNKSTHGYRHTRLYAVWCVMKQRCNNPKSNVYESYGARGIQVCKEWSDSFIAFHDWAYANGYVEETLPNNKNKLTIDRIDVDGNYCPENCRWITNAEQQKNKRNIHNSEN